jgi:hypothetical protein
MLRIIDSRENLSQRKFAPPLPAQTPVSALLVALERVGLTDLPG